MSFSRVKVHCFPFLGAVALPLVVMLAGCSKPGSEQEVTSLGLVRSLVFSIGDAAMNARADSFESLFVEGAAPQGAERSKYGAPLLFKLQDDPEISGDGEATLNIKVLSAAPNAEPQTVGEVQWTAVKVADKWKLKSAPLP